MNGGRWGCNRKLTININSCRLRKRGPERDLGEEIDNSEALVLDFVKSTEEWTQNLLILSPFVQFLSLRQWIEKGGTRKG